MSIALLRIVVIQGMAKKKPKALTSGLNFLTKVDPLSLDINYHSFGKSK